MHDTVTPGREGLRSSCLRIRATSLLLLFLLAAGTGSAPFRPVQAQLLQDEAALALKDYVVVGGTWRSEGSAIVGEVDGTTRAFALLERAPFAGEQSLEAAMIPQKKVGADWSAGGVCLYQNLHNYWRLALAESPDGKERYAELQAMEGGQGRGEGYLRVLLKPEGAFRWEWGKEYRLRLTADADSVTGEVYAGEVSCWKMRYALSGTGLVRSGKPALGLQGMRASFRAARRSSAQGAIGRETILCRELKTEGLQGNWLSLPLSRLIVNPHMSADASVPPAAAPMLPLNMAYYAGQTPVPLPYFWAWRSEEPLRSAPAVIPGPTAEFTPEAEKIWRVERATMRFTKGSARLSVETEPFGSMSTAVSVDLNRAPYLIVHVPETTGQWALKVNPGDAAADIALQGDTSEIGNFVYDLRKVTGWKGRRTFQVILFAIGRRGNAVTVDSLRFVGAEGENGPKMTSRSWAPHCIVSAAEAPGLKAEATVCLPDVRTVAQRLKVVASGGRPLVLMGQMLRGQVRWNALTRTLNLENDRFQVALTVSRKARFLGVSPSAVDLLAGGAGVDQTEGGAWALAFDGVGVGEELVVVARFARPGENAAAGDDLSQLVAPAGFAAALERQEKFWEAQFGHAPQPLDWQLRLASTHGVTAGALRSAYYRAWAFLLSDTLPPMPEADSPFPQVACGKPSLWAEGAPHSRASSQWESVLGMQYLALIDPETAWQSFEGLMAQVDAQGALGGEGLPSRHAQTAWVLYSLTGDRERLARVYPAVKRFLVWKAANPRWIYKNSTPPGEKDAEFVVHALLDMGYAHRIAEQLGLTAEVTFWNEHSAALAADFHRWFWGPGGKTYRLYNADTARQAEPDRSWNLQGLALPSEILRPEERAAFLKLFRTSVSAEMPFLIPQLAGFPKYNYTLRGLWRYGEAKEANLMAEAALRDVTLAGEFSESYSQQFPPTAMGVLPSLFGALQVIDAALWHNGVCFGDGAPILTDLTQSGGMANVRLRGGTVTLLWDGLAGRVTIEGSGLRTLPPPNGYAAAETTNGTPLWTGKPPSHSGLPVGTP
ncbi:MAG: hypothetical protein JWL77_1900 [Chthonomonadaceae bacterium]|nr:hypothetical protein [Chthonomonadaceae bacterium]